MKAIQWLLNERGYPVAVDGIFGATTVDAVKAHPGGRRTAGERHRRRRHLGEARRAGEPRQHGPGGLGRPARAACEAAPGPTDRRRLRRVDADGGPGVPEARGPADHGRRQRRDLAPAHLALRAADVQQDVASATTASATATANWATSAATNQLEAAARVVAGQGHGRVAVGDASLQHGGDIAGHETHERGLDVDLRLMRKGKDQCRWGGNYRASTYDRAATRALVKAIRATAPGHVKLIYFNDPVLIKEGLTTRFAGHDDHLHVRYCEKTHPLKKYDC